MDKPVIFKISYENQPKKFIAYISFRSNFSPSTTWSQTLKRRTTLVDTLFSRWVSSSLAGTIYSQENIEKMNYQAQTKKIAKGTMAPRDE